MELFLRAQDTADFKEEDRTDVFAYAKKSSPLLKWTFWSRLKACHKNGELGATVVMLGCGVILACMLGAANLTEKMASLFRS